jgi:hypothetical protein
MRYWNRIIPCISLSVSFTHIPQYRKRRLSFITSLSSSGVEERDDQKILELYRTVAKQDPEWYQAFVRDILQEDMIPTESNVDDNTPKESRQTRQSILKFESINNSIQQVDHQIEVDNVLKPNTTIEGTIHEISNDPIVGSDDEVKTKGRDDFNQQSLDSSQRLSHATPGESLDVQSTVESMDIRNNVSSVQEPLNLHENVTTISSQNSTSSRPTVVLYRDLETSRLLVAPLQVFRKLGYTEDEVSFLQSDVLSLILEDQIRKPKRGVPQQWKMSPSQKKILPDDVRIVSKEEAKEILTSIKTRRPPRGNGNGVSRKEDVSVASPKDSSEPYSRSPRRRADDYERKTIREKAVNRDLKSNDENIRSSMSRDRGDPPSPVNPVWVDIDTFRDLLRKEAEFRVRILGEDWKQPVKKESKWRLDLYKEWLWSLSDGVGGPIVESRIPPSRNNRARRDTPSPRNSSSRSSSRISQPNELPSEQNIEREILDPRTKRRRRSSERKSRSSYGNSSQDRV